MIGLPYGEKTVTIMLSRFHPIPGRYGQTDRQTDRIATSISRVSVLTRDKNLKRQLVRRRRHESCRSSKPKLHFKKHKINKIWRQTIFNMADGILTPCNLNVARWHWFRQATAPSSVACGSGIMTVNSSSGSTLQRDTWLWDDMPLNSPSGSTLQCDT